MRRATEAKFGLSHQHREEGLSQLERDKLLFAEFIESPADCGHLIQNEIDRGVTSGVWSVIGGRSRFVRNSTLSA